MDRRHFIRKYATKIIEHLYFERLSTLVIIANSIVIAIADYSHVDSHGNLVTAGSVRNNISAKSEEYFTFFFLVEFVIKVTALGFIGDQAYMSDSWHWLDFIVVVAG